MGNPTESAGRFVLIGTPRALIGAMAQVRAAGIDPTRTLGAVILGARDEQTERRLELPVLGVAEDLHRIYDRFQFELALVSAPAAMGGAITRIRATLRTLGVAERFLPTIEDALAGDSTQAIGRALLGGELDLAALVGRTPKRINEENIRRVLTGRRVLITGSGGSIGSELARIAARFEPSALILMDRSDNALFEIDREIAARFPRVPRQVVLHDVVDSDATLRRLVTLRPEVVFHAAAHKHVPLMEDHPAAAVNNNLFGTRSVADAALAVGAERFVMISTDKAVNPTSVMGATKRLAELYVRSLNTPQARTHFSLVRFGNVLGSACSVLPIWARQLAEGGPLTVTHREMTRYFMTIPEAASLVIQAAAIPGSSADRQEEVFVLDMGEPVRILELAERFVAAHGFEPVIDGEPELDLGDRPTVRIAITGPRPGEKLYEELSYQAEDLEPTAVPGVLAWTGHGLDRSEVAMMLAEMSAVRHSQDAELVIRTLQKHVPEMRRPVEVSNSGFAPSKQGTNFAAA